jgi:hypothetical protein
MFDKFGLYYKTTSSTSNVNVVSVEFRSMLTISMSCSQFRNGQFPNDFGDDARLERYFGLGVGLASVKYNPIETVVDFVTTDSNNAVAMQSVRAAVS